MNSSSFISYIKASFMYVCLPQGREGGVKNTEMAKVGYVEICSIYTHTQIAAPCSKLCYWKDKDVT
jgi:hypothetical protein